MADLKNPAFKKLYSLGVVNDNIENQLDEDLRKNVVYFLFGKSYHAIGNVLDISDTVINVSDFVDNIEQLTFYRNLKNEGIIKYISIIIFKECLVPPLREFVSDKLLRAALDDKELYFKINKNIHIWGILGATEITVNDDIKILVNVTELQNKDGEIFNVLPEKGRNVKKGVECFHLPAVHNDELDFSELIKRWRKRVIDEVNE